MVYVVRNAPRLLLLLIRPVGRINQMFEFQTNFNDSMSRSRIQFVLFSRWRARALRLFNARQCCGMENWNTLYCRSQRSLFVQVSLISDWSNNSIMSRLLFCWYMCQPIISDADYRALKSMHFYIQKFIATRQRLGQHIWNHRTKTNGMASFHWCHVIMSGLCVHWFSSSQLTSGILFVC